LPASPEFGGASGTTSVDLDRVVIVQLVEVERVSHTDSL